MSFCHQVGEHCNICHGNAQSIMTATQINNRIAEVKSNMERTTGLVHVAPVYPKNDILVPLERIEALEVRIEALENQLHEANKKLHVVSRDYGEEICLLNREVEKLIKQQVGGSNTK